MGRQELRLRLEFSEALVKLLADLVKVSFEPLGLLCAQSSVALTYVNGSVERLRTLTDNQRISSRLLRSTKNEDRDHAGYDFSDRNFRR